jgi:hypothetical protein
VPSREDGGDPRESHRIATARMSRALGHLLRVRHLFLQQSHQAPANTVTVRSMLRGFLVAITLALGVAGLGCVSTSSDVTATCSGPYPAPTPCDASLQCAPAACTCGDGTTSAFARGGICTDAGACDPQLLCATHCGPAGGLRSICR